MFKIESYCVLNWDGTNNKVILISYLWWVVNMPYKNLLII